MKTPGEVIEKLKKVVGRRHVLAFLWTVGVGLLVHLPILLRDIPNHDGLGSLYFDQNMITSGRWFLTVACGVSSYFAVPWIIGLLGLLYLGLASAVLTELLELKSSLSIAVCGSLLAVFPALASTFAYVFTMDGYMMALLLATLSVLMVKKTKYGVFWGALCLAFSLGIYQAYLPFAILLCVYEVLLLFMDGKWTSDRKGLLKKTGCYLAMGVVGFAIYYVLLMTLLWIQGKELASYQGIGEAGSAQGEGILQTIRSIYVDFWSFSVRSHVLFQNVFSAAAIALLALCAIFAVASMAREKKWWKKIGFYLILFALAIFLPIGTSCIRLVSPGLTYHLLMRYQWVLYPMAAIALCDKCFSEKDEKARFAAPMQWVLLVAGVALVFCYGLMDNIGYSNLEKKYEKTYAYCVRLLDRIEQTEGYYPGIPVALVGVVGEEAYPKTDLTGGVTDNMIGLSGDWLLYTSENYEAFFKAYLGATLNICDVEAMGEIYYTQEYAEMDGFPGPNSTKVVNGILYVKTENQR